MAMQSFGAQTPRIGKTTGKTMKTAKPMAKMAPMAKPNAGLINKYGKR